MTPTQRNPAAFERALWSETALPYPHGASLLGTVSADVAIVGGGYSGLSAALHLAEAGRSVALIEAHEPGYGASGRNAAGWLPNYLDRTPADVEQLLGSERGRALNNMLVDSGTLVPELVARHGIAADLRHSGILLCSDRAADQAAFAAVRKMWNERGGAIDPLAHAELQNLTGTAAFRHGLLFRAAGTLNPLAYARGLAAAATRAGAQIYCGDAAIRITPQSDRWQVETVAGAVIARQVLIATEGYGANRTLWPGLEKTVYHLPMAVVASRPSPAIAARLLPAGIPIADANKANPFWTMADGDGRIAASMLPPRRDDLSAAEVVRGYEAKLKRIYGDDLPQIDWTHFWIGTVAISAERIPRLLRLATGVHAIGGYSGQGIGAASAAGREYARLLASNGDESACRLPVFDPKPVPLQRLLPPLLRNVIAPLGRALDRSYRNPISLEK